MALPSGPSGSKRVGGRRVSGSTIPKKSSATGKLSPDASQAFPHTLNPIHNSPQRQHPVPATPRRRKPPARTVADGLRPIDIPFDDVRERLKRQLGLQFEPAEWQLHVIHRVLRSYDSMFCAGTGHGKSLVFEGVAALGGQGKVTIVISPLKALQRDQVQQAQAKGLSAVYINSDNSSKWRINAG